MESLLQCPRNAPLECEGMIKTQFMIFSQKLTTLNAQDKSTKTWSEFNKVITNDDDFYFLITGFFKQKMGIFLKETINILIN